LKDIMTVAETELADDELAALDGFLARVEGGRTCHDAAA
jgi:hypothetical protein